MCCKMLRTSQESTRTNKNQQTTPNGLTKGFRRISQGQKVLETTGTAEIICRKQRLVKCSQSTAHIHRKTIRTTTRSHCYSLQGLLTLLIRINVDKIDRYAQTCRDVDRKSTRLNSSHVSESRMPSSA